MIDRHLRFVLLAGAAAVVACGQTLAVHAPRDPNAAPSSATGTVAPDFTASDLAGKTFRLGDHLRKEVVLLDFWSTFCEPCKAEFPHLRALYTEKKASGLLVVGVAMDGPETVADVPAFARRFDLAFPIVTDEDSRIANLYNPKKSMPFSVLIDRAGHIAVVREGYNPGDEKLVAADVTRALEPRDATH
ncbi:MAG: TlpA family protein disulfide reductase [Myxococcota bacterium]|nr:TlpA family protein disulfide reductase [Myxococcota bacterium]